MTDNLPVSIEELLSRDPMTLSEATLQENVELLVKLCRQETAIWREEMEKAAASGKRLSGARTKKKQLNPARAAAASLIDFNDI